MSVYIILIANRYRAKEAPKYPLSWYLKCTYHLNPTQEGTELPNLLGKGSGINAVNAGDVVVGKPLGQTLLSGPVRMLPGVRTNNKASDVDTVALKVFGQTVIVDDGLIRHAVVAHEGVGKDEDLASVRWIG